MFYGFASDNAAGAHPRIIEAIASVNSGFCKPYGEDEYSAQGVRAFKKLFGPNIDVFFALSGTGANVLGLRTMAMPWHGIICADVAHINTDESGAPEWGIGAKLLPVPSVNGKIKPESLLHYMADRDNFHRSKPAVLSITQSTEKGTVYTPDEVSALVNCAHDHGLLVHMDGSRIANAVASLEGQGASLCSLTRDAGVDVLSFGGAKNGLLLAEAIVFFKPGLAADFAHMRKQSLQLVSKMRFVAAQFIEFFNNDLWLENARVANGMAQYLAQSLADAPQVELVCQPQANAVFAIMKPEHIAHLHKNYHFYEVDPDRHMVRLMCSFATTKEHIDAFSAAVREL